jgi:hypothetical protein
MFLFVLLVVTTVQAWPASLGGCRQSASCTKKS